MARTAQIFLLLLIAVVVQCHGARRYSHSGRSHGRYRNPYDYYPRHRDGRHGDYGSHDIKYSKHVHKNTNSLLVTTTPPLMHEDSKGLRPFSELIPPGVELATISPILNSNPTSDSNSSSVSDTVADKEPIADPTGTVNDDKPDDVATVHVNGLSENHEDPDHSDNSLNVDGFPPGETNGIGSENVDGMSPNGGEDQTNGENNIDIDGLTPDESEDKPDLGSNSKVPNVDLSKPSENGKGNEMFPDDVNEQPNDEGNINDNGLFPSGNNIDSGMDGGLSNGNPDGNINVDGLETGHNEKPDHGGNTIDVDGLTPASDNDSGSGNYGNGTIDVAGLSPNGNDGKQDHEGGSIDANDKENLGNDNTINVDGLSPNKTTDKPGHDAGDINITGLTPEGDIDKPNHEGSIDVDEVSPNGNDNNLGHDSVNIDGLSPDGSENKPNVNNINVDGLSSGGDDVTGHGNMDHGELPSGNLGKPDHSYVEPGHDDLDNSNKPNTGNGNNVELPTGDGSIGGHVNLPDLTGHDIDKHFIQPIPGPDITGHDIDKHFIQPIPEPDITGHDIDKHFIQPIPEPEGTGHDIDKHFIQPIPEPEGTGHDIDKHFIQPMPEPDITGHDDKKDFVPPESKPIFEGNDILNWPPNEEHKRPGKIDKDADVKKNNSMIPVLLPGGGTVFVHADALGSMPSYIIVMINGQPTLIQNPGSGGLGSLGLGNGNGGLDLNKVILGNIGFGGFNGLNGGSLPNWVHLGGLGGGSGGIAVMPNMQRPIWIGSQYPNLGGGVTGGPIIIPSEELPVPIPVPRPVPTPGPVPQPIPIPEPVSPDYVNFPGFPWPSLWNIGQPGLNINLTHPMPMPNLGANFDWSKLVDILLNLGSRLPKPQSQPNPQPQPSQPQPQVTPQPQPNPNPQPYPYPYPQPYPYPPPPYPYPSYPYPLPAWVYPDNKPTGPGKNVFGDNDVDHKKDTAQPLPQPQPYPYPYPVPQPQPQPQPIPEPVPQPQPVPQPLPEPVPQPQPQPIPVPVPQPQPLPEPVPQPQPIPQPLPVPQPPPIPVPLPQPVPQPQPIPEPVPLPQSIPEPVPQPQPKPVPIPQPQPIPEPWPQPQPKPGPVPQPQPIPEPLPQPQPIPEPVPQPHPIPVPVPQPQPIPEPWPQPQPKPEPVPQPQPIPEPLPQPQPIPEPVPQPQPIPVPVPQPQPIPEPWPQPQPKPGPVPQPQPIPEPLPQPQPIPEPVPQPHPIPVPVPQPQPIPDPWPQPQPKPEPVPQPQPIPEPLPQPQPIPEPVPQPQPIPVPVPQPQPIPEPWPQPQPKPEPIPEPVPQPQPEFKPYPRPHPHPNTNKPLYPGFNIPHTHIPIPLPKPTHNGKPGKPGLDSGLIDILNILLKFPNRVPTTNPPKNLGALINLLLTILKPGDKINHLLPNLNEGSKGDFGNLAHLLLHILDGRKEPNLNVLVEPGMDESTRTNLILLLNLLTSNLANSYHEMGYFESGDPLLYFLGHFPCDHPNIHAISGMNSNSNLWQLLANMYGHNYDLPELRLERSTQQENGDKPAKVEDNNMNMKN